MCPADHKKQNKLNGVNNLDISRFQQLAPGVYRYQLSTLFGVQTKQMVVIGE